MIKNISQQRRYVPFPPPPCYAAGNRNVEGTEVRKYETANNGNISLIGNNELTEVSFSSFFPSSEREYTLNNSMFGIDYVIRYKPGFP